MSETRKAILLLKKAVAEELGPLVSFVWHRYGGASFSREDAEDAVQVAFEKALEKADSILFKDFRHLKRWLYKVARNEGADILRANIRRPEIPATVAFPTGEIPHVPLGYEASSPCTADRACRCAKQVLGEHRPAERELLRRRRKGLTIEEMATELGENPNTVASRFYRARKRATRLLRERCKICIF